MKTVQRILCGLGITLLAFACMFAMLLFIIGSVEKIVSMSIVGALFVVLSALGIAGIVKLYPEKNKKKPDEAKKRHTHFLKRWSDRMTEYKIKKELSYIEAVYIEGLEATSKTKCMIKRYNDRFEFIISGVTYILNCEKIISISVSTYDEIQKQYVSSIGGAVMGAMLLGGLGAAIGGRAKLKDLKIEHKYIIFTYAKGDSIDYVILMPIMISSSLCKYYLTIRQWTKAFSTKKTKKDVKVEL